MSARMLVVCPSWVGDVVMATPALARLRRERPGAYIGALLRPGLDRLVEGCDLFDEVHVDRPTGVLGPKRVASRLRPRRYESALLLTNSFSSALIARIAGVRERFGYIRDARGGLLTGGLRPERSGRAFAVVPAIDYYWRLVDAYLLGGEGQDRAPDGVLPLLGVSEAQEGRARAMLDALGLRADAQYAVVVPGASKEIKRWPAERFAKVADHLVRAHGLSVLVSGGPGEEAIVRQVVEAAHRGVHALTGGDLGSLKALIRGCEVLVANDTGPRHIACAFRRPTVTLFGPTDHRWTTIRGLDHQEHVLADPTLGPDEVADAHPERCRIERIEVERVLEAVDRVLGQAGA